MNATMSSEGCVSILVVPALLPSVGQAKSVNGFATARMVTANRQEMEVRGRFDASIVASAHPAKIDSVDARGFYLTRSPSATHREGRRSQEDTLINAAHVFFTEWCSP